MKKIVLLALVLSCHAFADTDFYYVEGIVSAPGGYPTEATACTSGGAYHDSYYGAPGCHTWSYAGNALCKFSHNVCGGDGTLKISHVQSYVAVFHPQNPMHQCPVGNPIVPGTGVKIQHEEDIPALGAGEVHFDREYENSASSTDAFLWHHNYDVKIVVIEPSMSGGNIKKSNPYPTQADACSQGWSQIKSQITDSWAANTTAKLVGGVCSVVATNGDVVRNITLAPDRKIVDGTVIPGAIQIRRADRTTLSYQIFNADTLTSVSFAPMSGEQGVLERPNTNGVLWRFTAKDGEISEFSVDGRLSAIVAPNGLRQTLTYDPITGLLSRVQDAKGRSLTFSYSGALLSGVTTSDSKITSYTYNASNLVTDVARPDGTHRKYHYEDIRFPTFLTGITDERNVRFATWAYDDKGRAVMSEHAGGADHSTLTYGADGSTTFTNALGKQTIFRFAEIAGMRRVVAVEGQSTPNCLAASKNYTYTAQGWIASKTDWKGIKTTYSYNTIGQEISRTEAVGTSAERTITTEWHPTLNVKTKIIEPDHETVFTYDANGLLVSQKTRVISVN